VTFLVVFPTVEFFNRVVGPSLPPLPWQVRDMVMALALCVVLSNALPLVNRRLERWLSRDPRAGGGHTQLGMGG